MSHLYSDEQKHIREEGRRALAAKCSPARLRVLLEAQGAYDGEAWGLACELGWTALAIPENFGGLGLGLIEQLIIAEECGRALFSAPYLATGAAAARILTAAGDPDGTLARLAAGEIRPVLAFAENNEPLPKSPTLAFRDGQVIGRKTAVLGAASGNIAFALASNGDTPSLVMVDLDHAAVTRQTLQTIDNSRCVAHIEFQGAPATRLEISAPLNAARDALSRLALFSASEAVGGADACIALSAAYANERVAFGQPIGKFQAVKHAIAEMYVQNELARASTLDAAVQCDAGAPDAEACIAAAHLNAMQAYGTASAGATQIHGALGVTWEADLHLHYRRARALALEGAPSAYWEDLIVTELSK